MKTIIKPVPESAIRRRAESALSKLPKRLRAKYRSEVEELVRRDARDEDYWFTQFFFGK